MGRARWSEADLRRMAELGVVRVVNAEVAGWRFKRAAYFDEEARVMRAFHVTDDPGRLMRKLAQGKDPDADATERDLGQELGPGLYVSDAPQIWMNRSRGKWAFLATLTERQRAALAQAVLDELHEQKAQRYISPTEYEVAVRDVKRAQAPGEEGARWGQEVFPHVASQPYNILVWQRAYLEPLGIEASPEPEQIPVTFKGDFAEMDRMLGERYVLLREMDLDGAFLPGGFAWVPQTVIWTRRALVAVGDFYP